MKKLIVEIVTLSTAKGRLLFFVLATLIVYFVPYSWLNNLSLWQRLGWDSAPSIGLTRSYYLLIHGNPIGAWHRNSLIYIVLVVWLVIMVKDIAELMRNTYTKTEPDTDTIV